MSGHPEEGLDWHIVPGVSKELSGLAWGSLGWGSLGWGVSFGAFGRFFRFPQICFFSFFSYNFNIIVFGTIFVPSFDLRKSDFAPKCILLTRYLMSWSVNYEIER